MPARRSDCRPTRRCGWRREGDAEAETVLFNLTGLANYYGTYLTTWQAGQPRPGTSTLNLSDRQVASNQAVVPLGVQRAVDVYNFFGYTNIVVDVFGYFAPRPA